ncbi:unnamed protein product [Peniophora sp. CBMAI 1063]|nr:unnamed protein product [Peniophora sp. CBMAI 1063]
MSSNKDFTVAIVGGGIAGLVCAVGLARAGVEVDVFEAASKYEEIGAGIGIGANAMRSFEGMGILEEVKAHSQSMGTASRSFKFVRGTEPHDVIYDYPIDVDGKNGNMGAVFHRAAFLDVLSHLLPTNARSHFNKRCVSVYTDQEGRVRLRFTDDTVHEADVVIGADGIKSVVRTQVIGEDADRLVDTGTSAYRALIPVQRLHDANIRKEFLEDLLKPSPRGYIGLDKHIITYAIMNGTMLNISALTTDLAHSMVPAGPQASWVTWVQPATREDVLEAFKDFGPDVRAIFECIEKPTKWAMHGLYPPLESHVFSAKSEDGGAASRINVVLVGDAAHAMLSHLGAGASVGIEGAYVLTSLLAHPQTKHANLSDVLRAYNVVRVPRAAYVANGSKRAGDIYQGHGPSGPGDKGRRKDLDLQWEPIWNYDTREELSRAVKLLGDEGVFARE